jgi:hypothetical protein
MIKNIIMKVSTLIYVLLIGIFLHTTSVVFAAPTISAIGDNRGSYTGSQIPKYEKLELTFSVETTATNLQFPYDPAPPAGVIPAADPQYNGISVDAKFTAPDGSIYFQPAFVYYAYTQNGTKTAWNGNTYAWTYPTDVISWKVRFSPHQTGTWTYQLIATDSTGTISTNPTSFVVTASANKGFIRVSKTDPRYFEFENGTIFNPYGTHANSSSQFAGLSQNGMNLIRNWWSGSFGTGWPEWLGNRNQYDGYLPRTGYLPISSVGTVPKSIIRIDYEKSGDINWFDACRMQDWNVVPEAIKPNTAYTLKIIYNGTGILGPRNPASAKYGVVGKITTNWLGDRGDPCYDSTSSYAAVTSYGHDTPGSWGTIEGTWNSGTNYFLPRIYVALENVTAAGDTTDTKAIANILSISLRENLNNGQYGPEIIRQFSSQSETYIPDKPMYDNDAYLESAKTQDMYLKIVLMDKNDTMYKKINDTGAFASTEDNDDGFYGCNATDSTNPPGTCPNKARTVNKNRWLQQAYWRYLQARFGYSPNIHSWEVTNEGDPFLTQHWELTDEMGKYMHCRVFGVAVGYGDGDVCSIQQPNAHLVTTSFWHSFPGYDATSGTGFWGSPKYKNVDYADVHAYITTAQATAAEKALMEKDSAFYHLWASNAYGSWKFHFPIVRGEAGMTPANGSTDDGRDLGIQTDTTGQWFHDYVWSGLDSGSLYEIYWYYDHIVNSSPTYDHRPFMKYRTLFLNSIPLANGHYTDAAPIISNATSIRAMGQKDTINKRAHLWIQNSNHTWKNVVDGVSVAPVSGSVSVAGFSPNATYPVEWWNTYTGHIQSTDTITANAAGTIVLPITSLLTDLAVKIGDYSQTVNTPTPLATKPGDANGDGLVDGRDYIIWVNHYGTASTGYSNGDFNNDSIVDGRDYIIWVNNYGK